MPHNQEYNMEYTYTEKKKQKQKHKLFLPKTQMVILILYSSFQVIQILCM